MNSERPWHTGKFTIAAGLKPLGDRPVFEREKNLSRYLENKAAARAESLIKHYPLPVGLTEEEMKSVANALAERLAIDLPEYKLDPTFPARDDVDFIISQVSEDFSVWKRDEEKEWLALIHLSCPNHWDARVKIGKPFINVHEPIPHMGPVSKAAPKLFEQVVKRGAFERYAWGVATDNRLNHHPEPAPGWSEKEWQGRSFDPAEPELFIRYERQTIFPINENMLGFTIKTKFTDVSTLPTEDLTLIATALQGMDTSVLSYKGLIKDKDHILNWISSLINSGTPLASLEAMGGSYEKSDFIGRSSLS